MKSKKVVISITNDIVYDQRMIKTAQTLSTYGYQVLIVGRMKSISPKVTFGDIDTYRFSMIFQKGKLFYLEYNLRLFIYLLTHSMDILCAVDLDTIIPNVVVSKIKNISLVYDAHEYFTEVPELEGRFFEKKIWKWIEKLTIPQCNTIYTVSEKIAELYSNEYKKPCDIIFNYPKKIEQITREKNSNLTLIYQGNLNEGRGLDIAIKSMKNIDGALWIVGDGIELEGLKKLCLTENVQEKVRFFGFQTPTQLAEITPKAHFGLNLLEDRGLSYRYSLANKYFDYIQCKVIPISMNFSEYKKINDKYNCSILLSELSEYQLTTLTNEVIEDKNIYDKLVENCDIASRFLTWENQEKQLCSIYNEL